MKILFPDTTLIESMEGVELGQGEITRHEKTLIAPEYPWEDIHTYLYGSVLKRGPLYRMWYQSYVDGRGFFVNYARSRDGMRWEKPLFRKILCERPGVYPTVEADGRIEDFYSKRSGRCVYKANIVSTYHIPSVIYDAGDKRRPYKLFGYTDKGYCVAFSQDGLHFREYGENPVLPVMRFPNANTGKTWFSDVAPAFRDGEKNRFVAFVKTYAVDHEGRTRRCVGFSESRDFKRWSRPETAWTPGEAEDRLARAKGFGWADFYGLCGFNYGNGYLGLLWLFFIDREYKRGTHGGIIEAYLAWSGDCRSWKRLSDEPFIPLRKGGWDSDMICTANAPVFDKDRILVYYGGANFGHGIGHKETPYDSDKHAFCIGVASLGKDRFCYAHSAEGASFLTGRFKMNKGVLTLNIDASKGNAAIELLRNGKILDSARISGADSTAHKIRTPVRGMIACKVRLNGARLYSLEAL